ncbi:MAG: D-alanyl-D-alanine carboxypeptidase family protein, partial [Pseudoflavonifractor sp.]
EAVEAGKFTMDQPITVTNTVNSGMMSGASTQNIKPGEVMAFGDILRCALIPSANEACNILAELVGGSIDGFVALMNERAAALGCQGTHFMNPHGLHDDNHYTTAYDIALICMQAMKSPVFREIVSSKSYTVPATNLAPARELHDTNALISTFRIRGYYYENATGIKTGFTPEAGYCLASAATKGNRSLVAVVLGCERVPNTTGSDGHTYFSESKRLLEWGFTNFSRRTIIDSTVPLLNVPVTLSDEADHVVGQPDGSIDATLPNNMELTDFTMTVTADQQTLEAPVAKGQVLGKVTLSYDGKDYGTLNLVAVDGVARSELLYRIDRIQKFFDQLWVKVVLLLLIVLILILVVRFLVFGKRRRRGAGRRNYSGRRRR